MRHWIFRCPSIRLFATVVPRLLVILLTSSSILLAQQRPDEHKYQLKVVTDRTNAHYRVDEPIQFEITLSNDGKPVRGPRRLHGAPDGIVWVPGFGSGVFGKFDPKTEKWTVYDLPDAENQIPYALNVDPKGYVWICGTGNDTLNRFNPKTEEFIEFRLPTRVSDTWEIEFDSEGNVWTSTSGPARHMERAYGSIIKLEILGNDDGRGGQRLVGYVPRPEDLTYEQPRVVNYKNSPNGNLIDSEFTFLNRRLAEHYGIPEVDREYFRRVTLPEDSVRGGLLTHAGILKLTANGTVTSPVKRGSFVLSKLLGTPPRTPPDIASIDPDTQGTTTIRETLDAHRNVAACATCHQHIDPPGFTLECFDPIGGFRTRYRSTGEGSQPNRMLFGRRIWEYQEGLPVDASGVTADGKSFNGIRDFKQHLLLMTDQVVRNFIAQLVIYATGGEIQFADRKELDRVVQETSSEDFPVRDILHKIVQSRLFRNK